VTVIPVSSGQTRSHLIVSSGTTVEVAASGTLLLSVIEPGGSAIVSAGAVASVTWLRGATEQVFAAPFPPSSAAAACSRCRPAASRSTRTSSAAASRRCSAARSRRASVGGRRRHL